MPGRPGTSGCLPAVPHGPQTRCVQPLIRPGRTWRTAPQTQHDTSIRCAPPPRSLARGPAFAGLRLAKPRRRLVFPVVEPGGRDLGVPGAADIAAADLKPLPAVPRLTRSFMVAILPSDTDNGLGADTAPSATNRLQRPVKHRPRRGAPGGAIARHAIITNRRSAASSSSSPDASACIPAESSGAELCRRAASTLPLAADQAGIQIWPATATVARTTRFLARRPGTGRRAPRGRRTRDGGEDESPGRAYAHKHSPLGEQIPTLSRRK